MPVTRQAITNHILFSGKEQQARCWPYIKADRHTVSPRVERTCQKGSGNLHADP